MAMEIKLIAAWFACLGFAALLSVGVAKLTVTLGLDGPVAESSSARVGPPEPGRN